ncbi:MAG: NAD(P)/FAD-dependent oxidoreductase, partial [Propionibacteriaceae bacterium]
MNTRHVVIVGGVAGGMSTATRLRRLEENTRITVVEKTGYVSFANCGLPYFVGGVIEERSSLLLQTPQSLAARFGIDVLINTEATMIDPVAKTVTLASPDGERVEHYDDLVLSPGARPAVPPIPGIERSLMLRNVEDVDQLALAASTATHAVVIGGGFIGMEMAENLVHKGIATAVVEATA